jgi:mono/diheme cytochrome c family protein
LLGVLLCVSALTAQAGRVPTSEASIARGAELYKLHCTTCHGPDGKAQIDVIADATDLTEPDLYRNGSTPEDMHRSIEQGAGVAMPAWGPQLRNPDDLWHLVNFVRSLWPADRQAQ